ncbi:MAG: WHG domain-containing protein, partial [Deltaproteobacteria bacterium]|nr:WHG domain-containing protein [Deltaproteobacteria bacterium]
TADALLRTAGATRITLRAVAQSTGMSRTTPYSYFRDKNEIIDGLRARGFRRLAADYRGAIDPASSPLTQLRAAGLAYLRFARGEPQLYQLMFERPVDREASGELAEAVDTFRQVALAPLLVCRRGGLTDLDVDMLNRSLWAMMHGLVSLQAVHSFGGPDELDRSFDVIGWITAYGIFRPGVDPSQPLGPER